MFSLTSKQFIESDRKERDRYMRSPFYYRITRGKMSYDDSGAKRWLIWFKSLFD